MAAMRALLAVGMVLSPRGWTQLPLEVRQAIADAGGKDVLDTAHIEQLVRRASVGELRLVPRLNAAPNEGLPPELVHTLGPARRLTEDDWKALRPLDRHVLKSLVLNPRLLWRAAQEILPEAVASSSDPLRATVAHCEVRMTEIAAALVRGSTFLDGRAMVLARVAGVRAARRASETFDLRSEVGTGTIELDWTTLPEQGLLLWQAHVSTWDGAFYPAASLAAAVTAATAMCDMLREIDPLASIVTAKIVEEDWRVGNTYQEHATAVYVGARRVAMASAPPPQIVVAAPAAPAPQAPKMTPAVALPAVQTVASPGVVVPQRSSGASVGELSGRDITAPGKRRATPVFQQVLVIMILGLLVLLLLVAVAILVVVARH